jgi:hypothetical protein
VNLFLNGGGASDGVCFFVLRALRGAAIIAFCPTSIVFAPVPSTFAFEYALVQVE